MVAPTGAGKTRIAIEWAKRSQKKLLLTSPLVALNRQHEQSFSNQGLQTRLGSRPDSNPREHQVWILSPESLVRPKLREEIKKFSPSLWVSDECHTHWEWGSRFRPALLEATKIPGLLGIKKTLWLTATLSPDSQSWIDQCQSGSGGGPIRWIKESRKNPNSKIHRILADPIQKLEFLLAWVKRRREFGLIFVRSRSLAEKITALLRSEGYSCIYYHAGLSQEERLAIEERVREQRDQIIVCTTAFGMGMNYEHLQWCIIWSPLSQMSEQFQAMGRVGRRPGSLAETVFLYNSLEIAQIEDKTYRQFISQPIDLIDF